MTAQRTVATTEVAQDYKGVVKEWNTPLAIQHRQSSIYAGQIKTLQAHPSRLDVALRWTPAHVNIDSIEPSDHDAIRDARGNGKTDEFAKLAVDRHLQPNAELAEAVRRDLDDVAVVLKFAANILGMWPALDREELSAATCAEGGPA